MIIAICGKRRSGKDTVASILCELMPHYSIKKISQKLKDVCSIMFGFTPDQLETEKKDEKDQEWDITPRFAMQYIGTEIAQTIRKDIWIKSFLKDTPLTSNVIITDLRFLHEYKELKGAMIIRVIRNRAEQQEDNHVSENEYKQIPVNLTIENNGTLEDLRKHITDTVLLKINNHISITH